jgi:hypothetical protein
MLSLSNDIEMYLRVQYVFPDDIALRQICFDEIAP